MYGVMNICNILLLSVKWKLNIQWQNQSITRQGEYMVSENTLNWIISESLFVQTHFTGNIQSQSISREQFGASTYLYIGRGLAGPLTGRRAGWPPHRNLGHLRTDKSSAHSLQYHNHWSFRQNRIWGCYHCKKII